MINLSKEERYQNAKEGYEQRKTVSNLKYMIIFSLLGSFPIITAIILQKFFYLIFLIPAFILLTAFYLFLFIKMKKNEESILFEEPNCIIGIIESRETEISESSEVYELIQDILINDYLDQKLDLLRLEANSLKSQAELEDEAQKYDMVD